jgi:hypothetical protein
MEEGIMDVFYRVYFSSIIVSFVSSLYLFSFYSH